MSYTKGQRVRFTVDNLGVMQSPYNSRTVADLKINAGDTGTYLEPNKINGMEGWHIVAVNIGLSNPPILYCPVHESMIEPV